MNVKGYEVPAEVEQHCLTIMKEGRFRSFNVANAASYMAWKIGGEINGILADRIAARIIQRERLAGNIKREKYPWWVWCGKKGETE